VLSLRADDGRAVRLLALHLLPTALHLDRADGRREQLAARVPELARRFHPPGRAEVPLVVRWPADESFGPVRSTDCERGNALS